MNGKMLKYSFTEQEVNFILGALNRVQTTGVQVAQQLLAVVQKLQAPANSDELDKQQFETLKAKFEPKKDKKENK